ncbi:hypothetical protein M2142_000708 [Fusobacterium sp. PH5-29]
MTDVYLREINMKKLFGKIASITKKIISKNKDNTKIEEKYDKNGINKDNIDNNEKNKNGGHEKIMLNYNFPNLNRTILFETFNDEKLNLLTLVGIGNTEQSLTDEKVNEINKYLLVHSFEEFLEKFQPKIYSFFNAATQRIKYSMNKPNGIPDSAITEIPLTMENSFFKMLITLLDSKKATGSKNVDFNFKDILNMLSPKKVMDDIKVLRKEISYLFDKHEELEDGDPIKLEYGDKLNVAFERASENYNNILGMLPLAIEDIKTRLLVGLSENQGKAEEIKIGMLTMDDKGELKIIEEKPTKDKKMLQITNHKNNAVLAQYFEDDYKDVNENTNEYIKSLVVRTFAPLPTVLGEVDSKQEVKNYNQYLTFYKDAQEDFIKSIKPLIEKIMGVKVFFEQYGKNLNAMTPSLLITNISLEMLLKGDNKKALDVYLNTVNQKTDYTNTIWYGIIPSINLEAKDKKNVKERFAGTKKEEKADTNTIENLQVAMSILKDHKVTTFFSVIGNNDTTFSNLATEGIEKYLEKTKNLQRRDFSEYLVPCLPNFTIIPKEKSVVILDYKLMLQEDDKIVDVDKEELIKFWIEGVYVEASYVAAGLVAAHQCPVFLKKRFKKVDPIEPGVRINIEEKDNSRKLYTSLSKEITGYTTATKDVINRNNFGFVFSSDNVQDRGKVINNITVYKARTLASDENGTFEPIYKTSTATYIERILRYATTDFKEDEIREFFSNSPNSQKSKWLKKQKEEAINAILRPGDDISMEIVDSRCKLHINFNGDARNLELDLSKN